MKRRFRLTSTTDFQRVRRSGKSYAHPLFVLVYLPQKREDGLLYSRFGVVAGRAVGGAVERNRAKRRLRATLQNTIQNVHPGFDIILIARKPILDAEFEEIKTAVSQLFRRAKLMDIDV